MGGKYKILLSIVFILAISCTSMFESKEEINITVKVIDYYSKAPRIGDTVEVRKVKKPLFTMWQYVKVFEDITDEQGEVSVIIDRNRRYRFSSYGPPMLHPGFGWHEYEEKELSEKDTVLIEVKSAGVNPFEYWKDKGESWEK